MTSIRPSFGKLVGTLETDSYGWKQSCEFGEGKYTIHIPRQSPIVSAFVQGIESPRLAKLTGVWFHVNHQNQPIDDTKTGMTRSLINEVLKDLKATIQQVKKTQQYKDDRQMTMEYYGGYLPYWFRNLRNCFR